MVNTRSTSPNARTEACYEYFNRIKRTPDRRNSQGPTGSSSAAELPESQPPEDGGSYIPESSVEPLVKTNAAKNERKIRLEYHLYSHKKNPQDSQYLESKPALGPGLPEIVRFALPITEQAFEDFKPSLEHLKNMLFNLADEIDPNQFGNRNSVLLDNTMEKGLVTIRAYIDGHPDYSWDFNRLVWCDAAWVLFLDEVRMNPLKRAGINVTMIDPPKTLLVSPPVSESHVMYDLVASFRCKLWLS
ncbi:uncharacterized protein MELLADRAFT_64173 [Melampsora larici-populina 98AG31]|uniref:Uncharacterized protein n=1 Tax=Melampsora larici-populina (strain 98AG31 / pathotype 3-4-7) TaxID=747676 RepID=F4RQA0_MELLP|nr:uncharacterized protein MELLADRAFT_64173 [Melampsora larici-populina 98AG31]EGG05441.1 hypothetical protein MELLADRAFT_64173 [Melampsora larici-populina 98AG31]